MTQRRDDDVIRMTGVLPTDAVIRIYVTAHLMRRALYEAGGEEAVAASSWPRIIFWLEDMLTGATRVDLLNKSKMAVAALLDTRFPPR